MNTDQSINIILSEANIAESRNIEKRIANNIETEFKENKR
jgi:hypothetical protein